MQIVLAMAVGAGVVEIGARLWNAPDGSFARRAMRIGFVGGMLAAAGALAYIFVAGDEASLPLRFADTLTRQALDIDTLRALGLLALCAAVALVPLRAWRGLATLYGIRTALSAGLAALVVLVVVPGTQALGDRVRVLADYPNSNRAEMMELIDAVGEASRRAASRSRPAPRTTGGTCSATSTRACPALLQMGGGGLQASPNYDFLWSVRDYAKNAWIYDAPYLVFATREREHAARRRDHRADRALRAAPPARARPGVADRAHRRAAARPRGRGRKAAIEWLQAPTCRTATATSSTTATARPAPRPTRRCAAPAAPDSPGDRRRHRSPRSTSRRRRRSCSARAGTRAGTPTSTAPRSPSAASRPTSPPSTSRPASHLLAAPLRAPVVGPRLVARVAAVPLLAYVALRLLARRRKPPLPRARVVEER